MFAGGGDDIGLLVWSHRELVGVQYSFKTTFPIQLTGAIVADIGSYASRIGYAGDDLPRAYFPTVHYTS
jgi:Actin